MRSGEFTSTELAERTIQRRAIEAVIWSMPVVNFDLMYQAAVRLKSDFNQIVYWSRLFDWKNQTLTPNPDSVYLVSFWSTKDVGPVVLEIPPADDGTIVGSLMDCWQTALEDVGPAGVDKGNGGRYVILPPDHKDKVPDGYIPLSSDTFQGYGLLRSILKSGSDDDVAKAVAYAKRIKVYPLSQAANPPATVFVDAIGTVFDSTIPYDLPFFQSLHRMVQYEPWQTRDKVMIDQLRSIGIEKGKPFDPDVKTRALLKYAILEAHAYMDSRYDDVFKPPFYEEAHWALPAPQELIAGIESFYTQPQSYPVDARGLAFSYAFFSAKHLGEGQFYLMTTKDSQGRPLEGGSTYCLKVPANPPVKQYWSATAYDRATHALIRDMPRPSRSSQNTDLKKGADGSVNVYFGPEAPMGKQSNWVPTKPKGKFEVLFRFYGPEKALFDKTWRLPDIELASIGQAEKAA